MELHYVFATTRDQCTGSEKLTHVHSPTFASNYWIYVSQFKQFCLLSVMIQQTTMNRIQYRFQAQMGLCGNLFKSKD